MIGDRHPFVVLRQRIFRRQQCAGGDRVVNAGVEVRVVRNIGRTMEDGVLHRHQQIRGLTADLIAVRSMVEQFRHCQPKFAKPAASEPEQQIERRQLEHRTGNARRQHIQPARLLQIENAIPDGDPDTGHRVFPGAEDSQRQILDWKVGVGRIRRFDKAAAGRVVSVVNRIRSGHAVSCQCSQRSPASTAVDDYMLTFLRKVRSR